MIMKTEITIEQKDLDVSLDRLRARIQDSQIPYSCNCIVAVALDRQLDAGDIRVNSSGASIINKQNTFADTYRLPAEVLKAINQFDIAVTLTGEVREEEIINSLKESLPIRFELDVSDFHKPDT
jgi:hypothetical protein